MLIIGLVAPDGLVDTFDTVKRRGWTPNPVLSLLQQCTASMAAYQQEVVYDEYHYSYSSTTPTDLELMQMRLGSKRTFWSRCITFLLADDLHVIKHTASKHLLLLKFLFLLYYYIIAYYNNNNNTLIYIAPACRMTSEALADSSSRATE